jgi:hypothetical protein
LTYSLSELDDSDKRYIKVLLCVFYRSLPTLRNTTVAMTRLKPPTRPSTEHATDAEDKMSALTLSPIVTCFEIDPRTPSERAKTPRETTVNEEPRARRRRRKRSNFFPSAPNQHDHPTTQAPKPNPSDKDNTAGNRGGSTAGSVAHPSKDNAPNQVKIPLNHVRRAVEA